MPRDLSSDTGASGAAGRKSNVPGDNLVRHASAMRPGADSTILKRRSSHLKQLYDTIARYERQSAVQIAQGYGTPSTGTIAATPRSDQEDWNNIRNASFPQVEARTGLVQELTDFVVPNPLSSSASVFVTDSSRRQRHLGVSSTWSFSWQIRSLLKELVTASDSEIDLTPSPEGATYGMARMLYREAGPFSDDNIPSFEHVHYLTTTILVHLGQTYYLFDQESFLSRLRSFYDKTTEKVLPNLWVVQIFLIIALGKLLLGQNASPLGPPGAAEFVRAMQLLPDMHAMCQHQIISVEILCLISFYLQSADMRTAAYGYIGLAQRLKLSIGLNREIPPQFLSTAEKDHRRRLSWTVYIIDRKLSVNMGCPLTLRDEDIDVLLPIPSIGDIPTSALRLHTKLATLIGNITSVAYRLNDTIDTAFIIGIQHVFSRMAQLAKDFTGVFDLDPEKLSTVSRTTASLHLLYYQCTILAVRPIMFVLAQRQLHPPDGNVSTHRFVSEPVVAILKTCVGAATTIINILTLLHKEELIEPFLPFDLEAAFSSAFVLLLMTIAYPSLPVDLNSISNAERIIDWICSRGNEPAKSQRRELAELRSITDILQAKRQQSPFPVELAHLRQNPSISQTSDWLWNVVDIGNRMPQPDSSIPSIMFMGQNLHEGLIRDDLLEQEWFWAGPCGSTT